MQRTAFYAGSGGDVTLLSDEDVPFGTNSIALGPSINNHGDVACRANLMGAGLGIYVWPDPQGRRVIGVGDPLDGVWVFSLDLGTESLNDRGEVAFLATLSDGRQAVFVAHPVPEPQVWVLAMTALTALEWPTRGRRKARHSVVISR